jgi:hypothetical protein
MILNENIGFLIVFDVQNRYPFGMSFRPPQGGEIPKYGVLQAMF